MKTSGRTGGAPPNFKGTSTGAGGSHWQSNSGGVYKVLALKTGDTILAELDKDLEDFSFKPTIDLINPIKVVFIKGQLADGVEIANETISIKPFLNLSDSVSYPISTEVILTLGDMKASAKDLYINYVKKVVAQREREQKDHDITKLLESISPTGRYLVIEHDRDSEYLATFIRREEK